ncbi:MAG: hypothetical protein EBR02_00760 [Alphaproteobacteria bacterium]|nr:hypothetical protein [Alphaproteobacteria bacterium]
MMELLKDAVANTNGEAHQYAGGMATVYCWGNFAGATIKLLVSPNGSVWFDLEGYALVQTSKPKNLHLSNCWMKGQVIGGTVDTDVNLVVRGFYT